MTEFNRFLFLAQNFITSKRERLITLSKLLITRENARPALNISYTRGSHYKAVIMKAVKQHNKAKLVLGVLFIALFIISHI
jgi:hypothetical protein